MLVSRLPPRIHAAPAGLYSCPYSYDTRPFVCEACPGNKVFRIWQAGARDSGNKIAASAHGMGSGGLAVDAMAIGCLGVERRVERFFSYLAISVLRRRSNRVCVYYCRTYYKAVRGGGRRRVDDMCYDRRRAEACVDSVFSIQYSVIAQPR